MYASSIYHPTYQHKTSSPVYIYIPVHPDVKLKKLPFFDLLGELLKPSTLVAQGSQCMQECGFVFHLTPQQANEIGTTRKLRLGCKIDYLIQIQMRFCLIEASSEQEDCYPQGISVKVNGNVCSLPKVLPSNKPGVEPKRPPLPLNITSLVCLAPNVSNHVTVSWNVEHGKTFAVAIYLVRKLSSSELLQRLKQRGIRPANYTRDLIKEKLRADIDSEIATTSLRVSLLCPLGKMRMTTPCRSLSCYHLQCFDASLYLQMNERKPTWMCPVCDNPAIFDNLMIDGYFQHILDSCKVKDCNEVNLHEDGSWSSLTIKHKQSEDLSPAADKSVVRIDVDDVIVLPETKEYVIAEPPPPPTPAPAPKKEPTVIDLTVSDSDDSVQEEESYTRTKVECHPISQNYSLKPWNKEDAEKALAVESDHTKGMKNETLIIQFPDPALTEDMVKNFHPGIENVHFQVPSSPRCCFVQLAENVNPDIAIKELSRIKFGNGKLLVERMFSKVEENLKPEAIDPYTLYIGNLPSDINVATLKEKFPTASRVDVGFSERMKLTMYAFIHYLSVDDAIDAFKHNHDLILKSRNLIVRFRRMQNPINLLGESQQQEPSKKLMVKDENDVGDVNDIEEDDDVNEEEGSDTGDDSFSDDDNDSDEDYNDSDDDMGSDTVDDNSDDNMDDDDDCDAD